MRPKPDWIPRAEDNMATECAKHGLPSAGWYCWSETPSDHRGINLEIVPIRIITTGVVKGIQHVQAQEESLRPKLDHIRLIVPEPEFKAFIFAHISETEIFADILKWCTGMGIVLLDPPQPYTSLDLDAIRDAIAELKKS